MTTVSPPTRYEIAAWCIAAGLLFLILKLHLLSGLLAGLLVHQLVHLLAPRLALIRIHRTRGKLVAVAILATLVVSVLTLAVIGAITFFRSDAGSISALLARMADILDGARGKLPASMADGLPENAEALRHTVSQLLREHATELQMVGKGVGMALVHILVGMVIGALISLREALPSETLGPLARAMVERAHRVGAAFRRIVFAQIRISALNTTLTGIYLGVVLPILGIHLPFAKTMIAITFLIGLMPVIGNLISNTIIVVVSLSYSLGAAVGSLAFLVIIHKLEYFVNARIVGSQIRAAAWELLMAMVVMEAAFGIAGVIAAPIFYAYLKDELSSRNLL